MITVPPMWTKRRQYGSLVMRSPDGVLLISYREMLRPLVAVEAALARMLNEMPGVFDEVSAIAPLVTREGEHAAMVIARATVAQRVTHHAFGFVFTDDYYACLHGVTHDESRAGELAAHVHDLVRSDAHMLGIRRRRFRYVPPAGWHLETCGLEATWRTTNAAITVQPAWPADIDARGLANAEPSETIRAHHGLDGMLYDVVVGEVQRTVALLQDPHYVYSLRLDTTCAEHRAIFLDVVRSIIPHPLDERERRAAMMATTFVYAAD